ELGDSILSGRIADASPSTRAPSWLRKAVVRGLAIDPKQRAPSMAALIAELSRDHGRRRRWVWAGSVFLIAVSASAVVYRVSRHGDREPTPDATGRLLAPTNMDFEQSTVGKVPVGWISAGQDANKFPFVVTEERCLHGRRCAEIRTVGTTGND